MYKSSGNSWGSQRTLELLVPPFSKVSAFCPRGTVTSTGTLREEFSSAAPQTPECAILSSEPGCHLVSYQCPSSLPRGEWGRSPVRGKRESSPILQISWQQQEDFTIPLCVYYYCEGSQDTEALDGFWEIHVSDRIAGDTIKAEILHKEKEWDQSKSTKSRSNPTGPFTTAAQYAKHFPTVHILLRSLPQPLMVAVIPILQMEKWRLGLLMGGT